MKEKILILAILLSFSISIDAIAQFRDSNWGDSKNDVIASEGQPEDSDATTLFYSGNVGGEDVFIGFQFIGNELHQGIYLFQDSYTNNRRYITAFESIDELLTRRYGRPESLDSRIVLDPSIESNEYIDEGSKIASGSIAYETTWRLDEVIIQHRLIGNNYDVSHGLVYSSHEYGELSKEEAMSDF